MTYGTLIHAHARTSDPAAAEKWLEELVQEGTPNAMCFNAVIQAWARAGDSNRAAHWQAAAKRRGVVTKALAEVVRRPHRS